MAAAKKAAVKKTTKRKTADKYKSTFAVGVTVQIQEYEPLKLFASEEVEHDGRDTKAIDLDLAKRVMTRLDTMTSEVALKVTEIKERAIEELSDMEEGEEE